MKLHWTGSLAILSTGLLQALALPAYTDNSTTTSPPLCPTTGRLGRCGRDPGSLCGVLGTTCILASRNPSNSKAYLGVTCGTAALWCSGRVALDLYLCNHHDPETPCGLPGGTNQTQEDTDVFDGFVAQDVIPDGQTVF